MQDFKIILCWDNINLFNLYMKKLIKVLSRNMFNNKLNNISITNI